MDGEMLMHAYEFKAKPENGRIEIPAEYKDKIVGTVRVIVLSHEQRVGTTDMVDRLLENPLEIENFASLTREETYERR
jgi:6-phosphofructokinase